MVANGKSGAQAQVIASGMSMSIRFAVPFASWLDHGYKEEVVFLRKLELEVVFLRKLDLELKLTQTQVSKRRRAKCKKARRHIAGSWIFNMVSDYKRFV